MIRPPKLVYAAFLSALFILAGIGVIAARAWNGETLWPAAVSAIRDSNRGADPDYVQGLAKLGIVKLPGYVASAGRSRPTK